MYNTSAYFRQFAILTANEADAPPLTVKLREGTRLAQAFTSKGHTQRPPSNWTLTIPLRVNQIVVMYTNTG